MKIDTTLPIAKVTAETPAVMDVFESLGIDYCCAGDQSVDDAAHAAGVDPALVLANLRGLNSPGSQPWNDAPLHDLIRHLTIEHHRLVREELAGIAFRLSELCSSPAARCPDLRPLRTTFTQLAGLLLPHMRHEEEMVFPTIEGLTVHRTVDSQFHGEVRQCLTEHGRIAHLLGTMRELRLNLSASNNLDPACRTLLETIATMTAHLHQELFLENCILFPRAERLAGGQI